MHRPLEWRAVSWWLVVLGIVVALKQHYSIATAAELEWMLRPLSLLLEWLTGHSFHKDSNYEWVSPGADVRLVKACAGVNFLLMSLMAYAWTLRPARHTQGGAPAWLAGRVLLLCATIVAAWTTSLLANSLRIIVAMTVDSQGADLHRLIGMMIYVPLLSLQLTLGDRRGRKVAFAGPVVLYLLLMVAVPILTGNAFLDRARFSEHLMSVSMMVAVMGGLYFLIPTFSLRHYAARLYKRFLIIRNPYFPRLCQPVVRDTKARDCFDEDGSRS